MVETAGYWLMDAPTRGIRHICWDGCMFQERHAGKAGDLEHNPGDDGQGAGGAWVELKNDH